MSLPHAKQLFTFTRSDIKLKLMLSSTTWTRISDLGFLAKTVEIRIAGETVDYNVHFPFPPPQHSFWHFRTILCPSLYKEEKTLILTR